MLAGVTDEVGYWFMQTEDFASMNNTNKVFSDWNAIGENADISKTVLLITMIN